VAALTAASVVVFVEQTFSSFFQMPCDLTFSIRLVFRDRDIFLVSRRKDEYAPHKILKFFTRRFSWYFGKLHFFIRHFPLPWRGLASRRGDRVLAGQFFVGQAPTENRTGGFDEAAGVGCLAFVVTERLFV
jgi:hypothetical protein